MAEKKTQRPSVWVAIDSFIDGHRLIRAGETVADGHPVLKGKLKFFKPFEPTHQLEAESEDAAQLTDDAASKAEDPAAAAEAPASDPAKDGDA